MYSDEIWGGSVDVYVYSMPSSWDVFLARISFNSSRLFWVIFDQIEMLVVRFCDSL